MTPQTICISIMHLASQQPCASGWVLRLFLGCFFFLLRALIGFGRVNDEVGFLKLVHPFEELLRENKNYSLRASATQLSAKLFAFGYRHSNNETGALQPIREIAGRARWLHPRSSLLALVRKLMMENRSGNRVEEDMQTTIYIYIDIHI